MQNYPQCQLYGNGQVICTSPAQVTPPTVTDQAQAMWFAYWPWIIATIFCCFVCLVMRQTGSTDLTVNHYETYGGYEVNDPSEDE